MVFLINLLLSVIYGVNQKNCGKNNEHFVLVTVWVLCYMLRDIRYIEKLAKMSNRLAIIFCRNIIELMAGKKSLSLFRLFYDVFMDIIFALAISFKVFLISQVFSTLKKALLYKKGAKPSDRKYIIVG